ncbi:MAG: serine/threonine protein kinase, partial [Porticoccaceae bacterium]|nr:serine/threonine protein kinase [Porticoccaceae bacterium]
MPTDPITSSIMTAMSESHLHPYDALTPDRVIDAVELKGHYSDARILPLNSYENRVYQVGIEDGEPLIAKFYRPQRWSREQILEEHQFTVELAELDIPVVPPLADSDGHTLYSDGDFQFALFPRRGGRAPELDNFDNLEILGRYLGRIHAAG